MSNENTERNFIPFRPDLKYKARKLRNKATTPEQVIWKQMLRRKQFMGLRFMRQKPIFSFIPDFYCHKLKLVIEIDGDSHLSQKEYDEKRTKILGQLGIQVIRYTNSQVMENLEGVWEDLERRVKKRMQKLDN